MAEISVHTWLTGKVTIESNTSVYPTLTVRPDGPYTGPEIVLAIRSNMEPDAQLAIAERILTGVQRWRDQIAEDAARNRTIADDLAAAKARIAELELAAEGDFA